MDQNKSLDVFENAPVRKAVLQNAVPAIAAMLMVLVYNLADTFFIGQTHSDLQVAAVSLCTPVFLLFMAMGTIFGFGGVHLLFLVPWEKAAQNMQKKYLHFVCGVVSALVSSCLRCSGYSLMKSCL